VATVAAKGAAASPPNAAATEPATIPTMPWVWTTRYSSADRGGRRFIPAPMLRYMAASSSFAGKTKYGRLAGALSWKKCRIRFKPVI